MFVWKDVEELQNYLQVQLDQFVKDKNITIFQSKNKFKILKCTQTNRKMIVTFACYFFVEKVKWKICKKVKQ